MLDAAIWAENVPFAETRDYVKKVLANTTNYAALLTGQPQSLRSRLGTDGATRCSVAGGERRLALRGQRRARNGLQALTVPSVSLL